MAKPKEIYLGPDFETGVRKSKQNLLAEVVLRRLHRNSSGFSFGKYLRNIISNKPFSGLDIAIENGATVADVLEDLKAFYNNELIDSGESQERQAKYQTYKITNPKTGTEIQVTFWTGNRYWNRVLPDSDVNSLIRTKDNRVQVNGYSTKGMSRDKVIEQIKAGKFEKFIDTKDVSEDLKTWSRTRPSARTNGKEGSLMDNLKDMVKTDAIEAGYRVAGRQMTKGVKAGILMLMKDKGMDGGKLEAIREVLDTEVGDAIISTLLGYGLTYVPQLKDDPRAAKLAEEFRINGMATAGNLAIDTTMTYLLPVVTEAMSALPAVEEKMRVEEHTHASSEEEEMNQEEEEEKKEAHA